MTPRWAAAAHLCKPAEHNACRQALVQDLLAESALPAPATLQQALLLLFALCKVLN